MSGPGRLQRQQPQLLTWSWLRTGDFASRNVFERNAGLAIGGCREHPVRPVRSVLVHRG